MTTELQTHTSHTRGIICVHTRRRRRRRRRRQPPRVVVPPTLIGMRYTCSNDDNNDSKFQQQQQQQLPPMALGIFIYRSRSLHTVLCLVVFTAVGHDCGYCGCCSSLFFLSFLWCFVRRFDTCHSHMHIHVCIIIYPQVLQKQSHWQQQ
jgi:hypothetical protein